MVRGLTANKRIGRERETIPAVREKKTKKTDERWLETKEVKHRGGWGG